MWPRRLGVTECNYFFFKVFISNQLCLQFLYWFWVLSSLFIKAQCILTVFGSDWNAKSGYSQITTRSKGRFGCGRSTIWLRLVIIWLSFGFVSGLYLYLYLSSLTKKQILRRQCCLVEGQQSDSVWSSSGRPGGLIMGLAESNWLVTILVAALDNTLIN